MSRSEFFTRAAERWVDELDDRRLTEVIDEALDAAAEPAPGGGAARGPAAGGDDPSTFVRQAAARLFGLAPDDDEPRRDAEDR
ncbi:MAG: hypothetical protein ACQSGP_12815 [Frankia sp.]